jgi:hypothetical protein
VPSFSGKIDVPLLLSSWFTGPEDDQLIAILSEIDPVAGTEIDPVFEFS